MDPWLLDKMVCPRDHGALKRNGDGLACGKHHTYPIVDGIPVMLLGDVPATHDVITKTLEKFTSCHAGQHSELSELISKQPDETIKGGIDPFVQNAIVETCGILYNPVIRKLTRYPIPDLRLPEGAGELFLDVGCNWGRWCIAAARKGYNPIGIDPSLEATMAARRVSRQLGISARYVVGDARYLPFGPAIFDIVFSFGVLQHFSKDNARISLEEVSRVIKDGGTSLIQMPNVYGIRNLYNLSKRGISEGEGFNVRYWRPSELISTFTNVIGKTSISVDGYFGLGIQRTDVDILPGRYKIVVLSSEIIRWVSNRIRWMARFADSLYLESKK